MAQGLAAVQVRPARLDRAARLAYGDAKHRAKVGGIASIDETLRGAEFFEVVHQGAVVARWALRVDRTAAGREGVIVAAVGGMRGIDLTRSFLPIIERQLDGVDVVKIETPRKGLVAKLLAQGYKVEGYVLRKQVQHGPR